MVLEYSNTLVILSLDSSDKANCLEGAILWGFRGKEEGKSKLSFGRSKKMMKIELGNWCTGANRRMKEQWM